MAIALGSEAAADLGCSADSSESDEDEYEKFSSSKREALVRDLRDKKISKSKGFRKVQRLNTQTGRYNQVLQCLTCSKEFTKLCNVTDHVRTH